MQKPLTDIRFDRTKRPELDFEILELSSLRTRKNLDHDPRIPHRVNFYIIMLITEGEGKHTIDFEDHSFSKGSVLTIRKDQVHHFHFTDAEGYMLLFTEEYALSYLEHQSAERIRSLFNELLYPQHSRLTATELPSILTLTAQIEDEFSQEMDDHTSGIIRNLLQIFTSKIQRIRSLSTNQRLDHKYTSAFMDFQAKVENQCREIRSVQHYANQLNISTRTLNNITHRVTQKSAKQVIDDITVLQIKRLLINTTLSVKEIAYTSGFEEPTNLFKYFKRFTGHTPEAFRTEYTLGSRT